MLHDRRPAPRRRRSCFEITREEQKRRRAARRRAEEDAVAFGHKAEAFISVLMSVLAWSLMPAFLRGGSSYPLTPLPAPRGRPVVVAPVLWVPLSLSAAPMAPSELVWTNIYSGLRAIWSGDAAASLVELRWRQIREHCPDIMTEIARIADATKQEREGWLREMRRVKHDQSPAAAARMAVGRLRQERAGRLAEDGAEEQMALHMQPEASPVSFRGADGDDDIGDDLEASSPRI